MRVGLLHFRFMAENSFDIVSKVDLQEVSNAIQQALKEIHTRYDLKDSKSDIQMEGKEALVLTSADEYKLKAVNDILQGKLFKRGVSLKSLTYGTDRTGGELDRPAKSDVAARHCDREGTRDREAGQELEAQGAGIDQGDFVRVSGKDRDTLQQIIAMIKQSDFGIDMQFTNYRSN